MRLNVSPRVGVKDPELQRELREHARQVNMLTEGRIAAITNAQIVPNPTDMGEIGDIIRNPNPQIIVGTLPGAYIVWGHICLGEGTPGTWYEIRLPVYPVPYSFPVPAPTPLLDAYPGAVAGFSLARRLTAASTKCLDVKRSSDGAIQTFAYDVSGNVDTAAITAFVGSGTGTVTAIYDQMGETSRLEGNGTIINAGSLLTLGSTGRPAMTLGSAGTDKFQTNTPAWGSAKGLNGNAPYTVFVVYRKTSNTDGCLFGWGNIGTALEACGYYDDGSTSQMAYAGGQGFNTTTPANNTHYLATFTKSAGVISSTSGAYRNGTSVSTSGSASTPNIAGNTPFYLGTWSSYTPAKLQGQLQEVIVYYGDQSANRAAIEANIRAYYGF